MSTGKVLLLRSATEPTDPFEQILSDNGFEPFSVPVLQFNYLNIPILADHLSNYNNHSGIMFTSQRSVEAVERALLMLKGDISHRPSVSSGDISHGPSVSSGDISHGPSVSSGDISHGPSVTTRLPCLDLPCYVVGGSTHKAAEHLGFKPQLSDSGNADKLAEMLIQDTLPHNKSILYPCGILRQDTLTDKLEEAGFSLKEIKVYETGKSAQLQENVECLIKSQGLPEYCVFFSPSGVQLTADLVSTGVLPISQMKIVAIGPTTKKELVAAGYPVYGVAIKPDPEGVLEALGKVPKMLKREHVILQAPADFVKRGLKWDAKLWKKNTKRINKSAYNVAIC